MIGDAVRRGRVSALEALRDRYAAEIDAGPPARDLASVGRRLESVLAELDVLKEPGDDDSLENELARRRMERQGGVAGSKTAGG